MCRRKYVKITFCLEELPCREFPKMNIEVKTDIEIQLFARLLCLRNTESVKILRREAAETIDLLALVAKRKVTFQRKKSFWIFRDTNNAIVNILKVIQLKQVSSLPLITRKTKESLYQWNLGRKNDLISRGFSGEEHRRVEFLESGFYFIADKINKSSELLYFVTKNQLPGYIKFRKLINGELCEFRQRKNKGKIYQIQHEKGILREEREEKNRFLGKNPRFRNKIIQGDCLQIMQEIEDNSVDLVIADLPYGKFQKCHWDSKIDLVELWKQIERIIKQNAAILLFGKEPFSSTLRMSNQRLYRYDLIWIKNNASNFVQGNKMPLNCTEMISVFYSRLPTYNPQKIKNPKGVVYPSKNATGRKSFNELDSHLDDIVRYEKPYSESYEPDKLLPKNYFFFDIERRGRLHPTQKPLELLKYLIRTFSNEGDLVLDPTCGSGTTCLASQELERDFIGIEKQEKYVEIAIQRLAKKK